MGSNMRMDASVLHLDLDAFYASVEQRDKPSLRGKPVVVGGVGGRGVVATASYEARQFGVHSAMSTREARSRCRNAAFLSPRFGTYREASDVVMAELRAISPLVEPLSLDEAFVDLRPTDLDTTDLDAVRAFATELGETITRVTGGLTASMGIGTSKFIAKVGSDLDKPDGCVIIAPGSELTTLRPLPAKVIPGVGPVTQQKLRTVGVSTVADLQSLEEGELTRLLGDAAGHNVYALARALDDRPVVSEREAKSVSVESTYDNDITDPATMRVIVAQQSNNVARRLAEHGLSGRTVTLKVRLGDFTTMSRSLTLGSPTDQASVISRIARQLLDTLGPGGGVRLLGVGVAGLADWVQEDLFADLDEAESEALDPGEQPVVSTSSRPALLGHDLDKTYSPGQDVIHDEYGRGWVWGSGKGVVTVRFETATSPPGPVRSMAIDDPRLRAWKA